MSSVPPHNWLLGPPSYYDPTVEGHEYNNHPLVYEMNSHFEPRHGQSPYSDFPAQGYLPLIQESSTQTDSPTIADVIQRIKDLDQTVAILRQSVCERLDKLEKAISATQDYINKFVPWSMEVHDSCTKLMEALGESRSVSKHEQAREDNMNPEGDTEDNIVQ